MKKTKLQETLERVGITQTELLNQLKWAGGEGAVMSIQNGHAKVSGRVALFAAELVAIKKAIKKLSGKTVKDEDVI